MLKSLIRTAVCNVFTLLFMCNICVASSRILAKVGEDIITSNNLEKRYIALIKTNNLTPATEEVKLLKSQLLHSLINEKVIMREALRLKIEIKDEDIRLAIDNIEASQNLPKGSFIEHHEQYGITKDDLWEQMRVKLAWQRILTDFILPTYGNNAISDKELNEFIMQNYPGFIKVNGFVYRLNKENSEIIKKLQNLNKDNLCDASVLKKLTGYSPVKVNSSLEHIKSARIRQIASFTQEAPNVVTADDKDKIVILVLCNKKPTISKKELNNIKEELKNKKMELYAEHYLKNLKRQMAIKINDMQ